MKKRISLYVRSVLTFLRIVITKIFNIKGFHSAFIQDFSITTKISVTERGKILLKKHIHTKRNVILCAEGGTLEIGEGCFFNNGCMAVAKERITIGNRAAFGPNVLIYDHDHDVRKEAWRYAKDENLTIPELLIEKYQGIRPAVGYPSLPDQSVNFLLDELLDMKQIGIKLTENGAMCPHASVCGLMFAHPASEYFSVGKIGEDQLQDYARRRGKSVEEMRKFLAANLQD